MNLISVGFVLWLLAVLGVLGGCVAVPVGPGYYAGAPGHYAPAYYRPPAYYGPSIGIGIGVHGGGHGFRHR